MPLKARRKRSLCDLDLKKRLTMFNDELGGGRLVILIYSKSCLPEIYANLSGFINEGHIPLIVCLNSRIPIYLEKLNAPLKLGEEYLANCDCEAIDNFVYSLIRQWYLLDNDGLSGITLHKGIHLGRIVEYDFQLFLIRRIKLLEVLNSIIMRDSPTGVVIISDTPSEFKGVTQILSGAHSKIRICNLFVNQEETGTSRVRAELKTSSADFLSGLLDGIMRFLIVLSRRGDRRVLVDKRICEDLSRHSTLPSNFIPVFYEKGLRIRWNFARKGMVYFSFYFFSCFSGRRAKSKPLAGYNKLTSVLGKQSIFYYKDLFVGDILRPKLDEYFYDIFPRLVKNIDLFETLHNGIFVRGFVLRHDLWELQRLSVELGKKFHIPSIVVQHGVFGDEGEKIIFADKIAVWGKMCSDIYKTFGNHKSKCVVTGNPKHDDFYNRVGQPAQSRKEICRGFNIDHGKDIVVLISDPCNSILSSFTSRDRGEAVINSVMKAMALFPDKQLIIKLHPYEDHFPSEEAAKYYCQRNALIIKKCDLYSLLKIADLVITKESSVGLKALILDKPLITLNLEKRNDIVPYVSSGAALGVYNSEDLPGAIRDCLLDGSLREKLKARSRQFLRDYAYAIDGLSSKRVIDFIRRETENIA